MAILTVWKHGVPSPIAFTPPCMLDALLLHNSLSVKHPCGGNGRCAKCAVRVNGSVSEPNLSELTAGVRLSCQIRLLGDAEVWLPDERAMQHIQLTGVSHVGSLFPLGKKYGAAVDIGTTTLAMKLFDLHQGNCISSCAMENPQRTVSSDVMGRIQAAISGEADELRRQIRSAIEDMRNQTCREAAIRPDQMDALVITGNTTMLYLLTGQNPSSLAAAPFCANRLFDEFHDAEGIKTYFPPCIHAFVGADITCAILASGMCGSKKTSMLCDIGTNGEIALWKDGKLYVTSTAAGPAFEGAGISCGCGSIAGAIDQVWVKNGKICVHTIGDGGRVGLCGSGLLDAIAAGMELEQIDESGSLETDTFEVAEEVVLLQRDIRSVQLAKAAIAAGIETLLHYAEVNTGEIETLYIAGGFGSHLNISSAVKIGLIPESLSAKVSVIGNGALAGAGELLLNQNSIARIRQIASAAVHVNLGGNAVFADRFIDRMSLETY